VAVLALLVAESGSRGVGTTSSGLDFSLDLSGGLAGGPSSSILVPDPNGPEEDVGETGNTDEERGPGSSSIVLLDVHDGSLNGRKDGTTSDTHDKKTGGSSSVSSKTGCAEDENDRVHNRFETHDGDQADNTTGAVKSTDEDDHDESADGASSEEDGSGDEGKKGNTNESTDSKRDETVRE